MIKNLACILLLLSVGCTSIGKVEFMDVVQDHRELTIETNGALIASIRDDIETRGLDGDALKGAEELIERLEMIERQSDVILDYVFTEWPDQELLGRLLKSKWKGDGNVSFDEEDVP